MEILFFPGHLPILCIYFPTFLIQIKNSMEFSKT